MSEVNDARAKLEINMRELHFMLLKRFNESMISLLLGCFFSITFAQLAIDLFFLAAYRNFDHVDLNEYSKMGLFLSSCAVYHFMEFSYKSEFHLYSLSWHDFQLDHSRHYVIAMCVALTEFSFVITFIAPMFGR